MADDFMVLVPPEATAASRPGDRWNDARQNDQQIVGGRVGIRKIVFIFLDFVV